MSQAPLQQIATVSRSKARTLVGSRLPSVLSTYIFLAVILAFEFISPRNETSWLFIASVSVLSLMSLVNVFVIVGMFRQLREKGIASDGEFIFCHSDSKQYNWIALNNISEIHVRPEASFKKVQHFPGIGFVLVDQCYLGPRKKPKKQEAKMMFRRTGCHIILPPAYVEPLEQVAARISLAAAPKRVGPIPVQVMERSQGKTQVLREIGSQELDRAAAPDDAAISPGTECVECGYDLRGLPTTSRCPECGTPAQRSSGGLVLHVANRTWIGWLVAGAFGLVFSGLSALIALAITRKAMLGFIGKQVPPALHFFGAAAFFLLGLLLLAVGAWCLTRPEPVIRRSSSDPPSRRLARISLFVPVAFFLLAATGTMPGPLPWMLAIWSVLPVVGMCFWYARHLLDRLSRRGWGAVARVMASESLFVAIIGTGLAVLAASGRSPGAPMATSQPAPARALDSEGADDAESADPAAGPASSSSSPGGSLASGEGRSMFNFLFLLAATVPASMMFMYLLLAFWLIEAMQAPRRDMLKSNKPDDTKAMTSSPT